ncbi:MAG: hypothetical protein WDW38_002914 [Sanguina aurantia]
MSRLQQPRGEPIPEESSSFLPPFANVENKQLDANVRELEKQLEVAESALMENSDRIKIMDEHLTNVQQELKYTQTRVESRGKEVETEAHLKALAEREMGRLRRDMEKLASERADLGEKVTSLQNQIYKGSEKMDQFKLLMNWNQEELEQWALAQRQKEEDNAALAKYRNQDDSKMRELALALEKTNKAVVSRRGELETEVVETQAAQTQLDKAAEDFRKLHGERQELIRQWDEAMDAMKQRDGAILVASETFASRKQDLRERQSEVDAQARFLDNEGANNKEVESRIAYYDREVAKAREAFAKDQERVNEHGNQVDLIRATLAKAAAELSEQTHEAGAARTDLDDKRRKLDAGRRRYAVLKRKLETEFGQLDSLDAKVAELERLRRAEETRLKGLLKQQEVLKAEQFKRSQRLFELRSAERELISDISGGQGQNKNLAARISALDEQVIRQQELLYNVEFQLQQMGRKVARAGGVRSEEETRSLNARIGKLTAVLEGVNAEHSMLMEQVKHAQEDLLTARRAHGTLKADKVKVDETLGTLKLENDMILRQVHRDGLRAELRMARDDIHRITLELRERGLKVEKLSAKYETISSKHRGAAEDGEVRSQAYFVIKAAQEREELQREGDALDAAIRKAEKEVAALETTLSGLMVANNGFGSSFKKVDSAASVAERAALREKLDRAYDKLKFKRGEEGGLLDDVRQSSARLVILEAEARGMAGQVEELARKKADADRQASEQADKATRAKRSGERLLVKLSISGTPLDADVRLAEVRDTTRAMLSELRSLAASHPGCGIAEACEAAGLRLPALGASGSGAGTPLSGSVRGSYTGGGGSETHSRPVSALSTGSASGGRDLGA